MKNTMLNGMMGLVVGDALGCPVQFLDRDQIRRRGPVTTMEGHGTFDMPVGTWTDDSSMALAALSSIRLKQGIDPVDIMERFVDWEVNGAYTPYGFAFDQGLTCTEAIYRFNRTKDIATCGKTGERANGNGALMRILPVCLYWVQKEMEDPEAFSQREALESIHQITGLTHNHLRSHIASGLYYFMARAIVRGLSENTDLEVADTADGSLLQELLQQGLKEGFTYYEAEESNREQLSFYDRTRDLTAFEEVDASDIRSSGYVVHSFEAAVWCLITTGDFSECLLKAVNLGEDTDTVAAIAGGLAGLYYGYDGIPADWLEVIVNRDLIEAICG